MFCTPPPQQELYPPPFEHLPTLQGYFRGWEGGREENFGPATKLLRERKVPEDLRSCREDPQAQTKTKNASLLDLGHQLVGCGSFTQMPPERGESRVLVSKRRERINELVGRRCRTRHDVRDPWPGMARVRFAALNGLNGPFRPKGTIFGGQKRPTKPTNRTNSTKEFSEQFVGLTGHCAVKEEC